MLDYFSHKQAIIYLSCHEEPWGCLCGGQWKSAIHGLDPNRLVSGKAVIDGKNCWSALMDDMTVLTLNTPLNNVTYTLDQVCDSSRNIRNSWIMNETWLLSTFISSSQGYHGWDQCKDSMGDLAFNSNEGMARWPDYWLNSSVVIPKIWLWMVIVTWHIALNKRLQSFWSNNLFRPRQWKVRGLKLCKRGSEISITIAQTGNSTVIILVLDELAFLMKSVKLSCYLN